MDPQRPQPLGNTGLEVTALGFGGGPLGNLFTAIDDATAHAAVDAAWDAGIRYFDTAPHYGLGLSEQRIGAALRDRLRDEYVLSTKVGRVLVPTPDGRPRPDDDGFVVTADVMRAWDYSRDGVRRSLDGSLRRLGVDAVDIVYVHDPDYAGDPALVSDALTVAVPALAELRDEGVVGAIGVGMGDLALLSRFVRETDIDALILAGHYTLLDQTALGELFPLCAQHGVGVVNAAVFHSGLLASPQPTADATYNYGAVPDDVLGRAAHLAAVCGRFGVELPAAALQFGTGHSVVASTLVGAQTAEQVRQNADRFAAPIPSALWRALEDEGLLPEDAPVPW